MNVSVIGTGYVGLTTGVTFAYLGNRVICADVDKAKVEKLQAGIPPIFEPGLEELLAEAKSNLVFTDNVRDSVREADVVFLAVGTPANQDGTPNLDYWHAAVEDVLETLRTKGTRTVLVNKSTVPVGTGDLLSSKIASLGLQSMITVASNPEFLRQGRAINDTLYPDRIVAGGGDVSLYVLRNLYAPLLEQTFPSPKGTPRPEGTGSVPFISVDLRSAELAKYAANAFLAMKISFINEIANVCDSVGADVSHISRIIGADPRIGKSFLQAGIGYGGSCFPKDTRALRYIADTSGYDFKLLSAVIEVNRDQKFRLIDKLQQELGSLHGKKIAILGLTFKPGTDDMRDAPSISIIEKLLQLGAVVYAHDPVGLERASKLISPQAHLSSDIHETLKDAEAALLLTEWEDYIHLDPVWLNSIMRRGLLIDGRNSYDPSLRDALVYRGIGISSPRNGAISLS